LVFFNWPMPLKPRPVTGNRFRNWQKQNKSLMDGP
jgi:hypothetical protein